METQYEATNKRYPLRASPNFMKQKNGNFLYHYKAH